MPRKNNNSKSSPTSAAAAPAAANGALGADDDEILELPPPFHAEPNHTVVQDEILNRLFQADPEDIKQRCSNCPEERPVVSSCLECKQWLCMSCTEAHKKLRFLANHDLQSISDNPNGRSRIWQIERMLVCPDHSSVLDQPINVYCYTCKQLICDACATVGDHHSHESALIKDVLPESRLKLAEMHEANMIYTDRIREYSSTTKQQINDLTEKQGDLEFELRSLIGKITSTLIAKLSRTLADCQNSFDDRRANLYSRLRKMERLDRRLVDIDQLIEYLQQSRSDNLHVYCQDSLSRLLERISEGIASTAPGIEHILNTKPSSALTRILELLEDENSQLVTNPSTRSRPRDSEEFDWTLSPIHTTTPGSLSVSVSTNHNTDVTSSSPKSPPSIPQRLPTGIGEIARSLSNMQHRPKKFTKRRNSSRVQEAEETSLNKLTGSQPKKTKRSIQPHRNVSGSQESSAHINHSSVLGSAGNEKGSLSSSLEKSIMARLRQPILQRHELPVIRRVSAEPCVESHSSERSPTPQALLLPRQSISDLEVLSNSSDKSSSTMGIPLATCRLSKQKQKVIQKVFAHDSHSSFANFKQPTVSAEAAATLSAEPVANSGSKARSERKTAGVSTIPDFDIIATAVTCSTCGRQFAQIRGLKLHARWCLRKNPGRHPAQEEGDGQPSSSVSNTQHPSDTTSCQPSVVSTRTSRRISNLTNPRVVLEQLVVATSPGGTIDLDIMDL